MFLQFGHPIYQFISIRRGSYPFRLAKAHVALDAAVTAAYGWNDDATLTEDEILRRLLALNKERAAVSQP